MQKYRYFVQGACMREKQEGKMKVDRFERALQRKPVKLVFMAHRRSYLPLRFALQQHSKV